MAFLPVWPHRDVIEFTWTSVEHPAGIPFTSRNLRGLDVTQTSTRHPADVPRRYLEDVCQIP